MDLGAPLVAVDDDAVQLRKFDENFLEIFKKLESWEKEAHCSVGAAANVLAVAVVDLVEAEALRTSLLVSVGIFFCSRKRFC